MTYPSDQLQFIDISQMPKGFSLLAPLSGDIYPLNQLNGQLSGQLSEQLCKQPLISKGILGEGLAIEMVGNKLLAPFDGIVTELSPTCQRIQLKASNGVKLLIMLPTQTSQLMGKGFSRQVQEQQTIRQGQLLLTFNLQQLQQLVSPCYAAVVITNAEKLGNILTSVKKVTAGEDVLFTVTAKRQIKKSK